MNNSLPAHTIDDEMRSLIVRYGSDVVREAATRMTKKKRGRKPELDWPLLESVIHQDAIDWLQGTNPFKLRTNYAMAKEFAELHPGQSVFSTKERIEKKLREQRRGRMLARAMVISRSGFPYSDHLRALEELIRLKHHPVWQEFYESALQKIERYREHRGELDAVITFSSIEAELNIMPDMLEYFKPKVVKQPGLLGYLKQLTDPPA